MFPTAARRLAQGAGSTFADVVKAKATRATATATAAAATTTTTTTTTTMTTVLKKVWPPDFSKLSPQEQLRFEKKYKRRIQLAMAKPQWNQFVRLAQLFSITFVIVYSVLFMDTKAEQQPFQEVRELFWGLFGINYTSTPEKLKRREDGPGSAATTAAAR